MGSYRELTGRGVPIISNSSQARSAAIKLGVPADSIILLPGDARSTLSEAMIVRKYLKDISSIDTIILVSSPAHLRRASIIFKNAFRNLPEPVFVGCSPSAYSSFSPDKWWRRKEDIQTVLTEYLKTGSFLLNLIQTTDKVSKKSMEKIMSGVKIGRKACGVSYL